MIGASVYLSKAAQNWPRQIALFRERISLYVNEALDQPYFKVIVVLFDPYV